MVEKWRHRVVVMLSVLELTPQIWGDTIVIPFQISDSRLHQIQPREIHPSTMRQHAEDAKTSGLGHGVSRSRVVNRG